MVSGLPVMDCGGGESPGAECGVVVDLVKEL